MAITLNRAIVPARYRVAAAKFFPRLFGRKRGLAQAAGAP
jgi:hypothetical protein